MDNGLGITINEHSPAMCNERCRKQRPGVTAKYLRCTTSAAAGNGLDTTIKYLRAAAGVGLGTAIKYLRGAAGIGLGTMIKYLRRSTSGAAGNGLCTTTRYLRGAAGIGLGTTIKYPATHNEHHREQRPGHHDQVPREPKRGRV
jgi:hypothetical protein